MNNFQLQKGQKVSCILYDGNSKIEASMSYEYLKAAQKEKKPMPLGNTDLLINVTAVELIEGKDVFKMEMNYKVKLEGVLE
jgi:hypothetical protein